MIYRRRRPEDYASSSDLCGYESNPNKYVFPFEIKEKSGKTRSIITYTKGAFGASLRRLHEKIARDFALNFYDVNKYSYAYHKGVSCLDALENHLRSTYFIKLDIHHFFETITYTKLLELYPRRFNARWRTLLGACFYNDHLSIGFVTSPVISDFFMSEFDYEVEKYIEEHKGIHYSRYSDDILLSSETSEEAVDDLFVFVKEKLEQYGFEINDSKTRKETLSLKKRNSLPFLGLNISKLNDVDNKVTISKNYTLFLLFLIEKFHDGEDSNVKLLAEINSRIAYLKKSSEVSYERFLKKYKNKFGKEFEPLKIISTAKKNITITDIIPDWDKYSAIYQARINQKYVNKGNKRVVSVGGVVLSKYLGNDTIVEVPDFFTVIGDKAFEGTGVEKVVLPETIDAIGSLAFANCSKLKEINIPRNVSLIESHAFKGTAIEKAVLPIGITKLNGCFAKAKRLKEVVLHDYISEISEGAFFECESLETIKLPKDIKTIPGNCFSGCKALKKIDIPDGVISIEENAFSGSGIESIVLPEGLVSLSLLAFSSTNIKELRLPENTIDVSGSVILPPSAKVVGNSKFRSSVNNDALITDDGDILIAIANGTSIPDGVKEIGVRFKDWCGTSVRIPSSVNNIGAEVFRSSNVSKVVIEGDLSSIGPSCFNSSKLEEIEFLGSVNSFGDSSFSACRRLKHITLPKGLENIGSNCFSQCDNLEIDISCPTLKYIGRAAFYSNKRVTNLYVGDSVLIEDDAFFETPIDDIVVSPNSSDYYGAADCHALIKKDGMKLICATSKTIIPEGTLSLERYSFAGVDMEEIVIPPTVRQIGESCFFRCKIKKITIPNSVSSIGTDCFDCCANLEEISIPNSVTSLRQTANNCRSLKKVYIPASVSEIGNYNPFGRCPSLEEIEVSPLNPIFEFRNGCLIDKKNHRIVSATKGATIPDDIIEIGNGSFQTIELGDIVLGDSLKTINSLSFSGSKIEKLTVKSGMLAEFGDGYTSNVFLRARINSIVVDPDNPLYSDCGGSNILLRKLDDSLVLSCENSILVEGIKCLNGYSITDMKNVVLPSSVSKINKYALASSSGCFESVSIGENVIVIEAYSIASYVRKITVSENNPVFKSVNDGIVVNKNTGKMVYCNTNIIPDGIEEIDIRALCLDPNIKGMVDLYIGKDVKRILNYYPGDRKFNLVFNENNPCLKSKEDLKTFEEDVFPF